MQKIFAVMLLSVFFFSNSASAYLSKPNSVTASVRGVNSIDIQWSSVSEASFYVREARIGAGDWIHPKEYISTSVSFENVAPNQYQYRVKSCNSETCSDWSYSNKVTAVGLPAAPLYVSANVQGQNNLNISWSEVSNAESYIREVKIGDGNWVNPKVYEGTSVSFSSLSKNRYQYRVKACNLVGCSAWTVSNSVSISLEPVAPLKVLANVKNGNSVHISWSSVTGADYYVREAKVGSRPWLHPIEYTGNAIAFYNVGPNQYQYRVQACNKTGCSPWTYSNIIATYPKPN
ncbi:fibronectin type III domain-containing protein [Pseudoalteromonas sp. B530]|uniref:fibronectin type III domain-containing protein n=1 Tax=Pseudoalteromonas sp. B530 TaxID=2994390 RepID=UPI00224AD302|nr:fibronectin type III domain-containing protein [Pseudoalteromonas sp. B530]MCX2769621.1 fibronectin type III domain-containing protein [Pseudoalteromonas sp. B530]